MAYSSRITDPSFAKYLKNSKTWSFLFAWILALIAIIGFYIYGETSPEMNNPQAILIGAGVGSMFLFIALIQTFGRRTSKTWDGIVIDKKIQAKRNGKNVASNDLNLIDYNLYLVIIKSEDGKLYDLSAKEDDTVYNYYKINDKVRHHKGLNSFEKYDKSSDTIVFCNACASLNDINDEYCFRCNCPLLK